MNTNASEPRDRGIVSTRPLSYKEKGADTLRDLVSMESGSEDVEGRT